MLEPGGHYHAAHVQHFFARTILKRHLERRSCSLGGNHSGCQTLINEGIIGDGRDHIIHRIFGAAQLGGDGRVVTRDRGPSQDLRLINQDNLIA